LGIINYIIYMSKKNFTKYVGSGETSIGNNDQISNEEIITIESEINIPLSLQEEEDLFHYENIIEKGLETFFEVGKVLTEIRDKKLYRKDYSTFEDYCIKRWGFQRRKAYRLIEAAAVLKNVSHGTQIIFLPQNERQARELARLPIEKQQKVWFDLISENSSPPTSKMVEMKVKECLGILPVPIKTKELSSKNADKLKIQLSVTNEKYQLIKEASDILQITIEDYVLKAIDKSLLLNSVDI